MNKHEKATGWLLNETRKLREDVVQLNTNKIPTYTTNSLCFVCMDTWYTGDDEATTDEASFLGIRHIEFVYKGDVIPYDPAWVCTMTGRKKSDYYPDNVFKDTELTGTARDNAWRVTRKSFATSLGITFPNGLTFDGIRIMNYHDNNTLSVCGVKNMYIVMQDTWAPNGAALSGDVVWTGALNKHPEVDTQEMETLALNSLYTATQGVKAQIGIATNAGTCATNTEDIGTNTTSIDEADKRFLAAETANALLHTGASKARTELHKNHYKAHPPILLSSEYTGLDGFMQTHEIVPVWDREVEYVAHDVQYTHGECAPITTSAVVKAPITFKVNMSEDVPPTPRQIGVTVKDPETSEELTYYVYYYPVVNPQEITLTLTYPNTEITYTGLTASIRMAKITTTSIGMTVPLMRFLQDGPNKPTGVYSISDWAYEITGADTTIKLPTLSVLEKYGYGTNDKIIIKLVDGYDPSGG